MIGVLLFEKKTWLRKFMLCTFFLKSKKMSTRPRVHIEGEWFFSPWAFLSYGALLSNLSSISPQRTDQAQRSLTSVCEWEPRRPHCNDCWQQRKGIYCSGIHCSDLCREKRKLLLILYSIDCICVQSESY
jgi:hypothetical protein